MFKKGCGNAGVLECGLCNAGGNLCAKRV